MESAKIIAIAWVISVCLAGCEKDKDGKYDGEAAAFKNGTSWVAKTTAYPNHMSDTKVDISIGTFDDQGFFIENVLFFKIPKKKGRYSLAYTFNQMPDDTLKGARYFNSDGDQLSDIFDITETDSMSYLEITEYNEKTGELKGDFGMVLWPSLSGSWNAPDSIVFSNGTFRARVKD
jgi:hypothetical protein